MLKATNCLQKTCYQTQLIGLSYYITLYLNYFWNVSGKSFPKRRKKQICIIPFLKNDLPMDFILFRRDLQKAPRSQISNAF